MEEQRATLNQLNYIKILIEDVRENEDNYNLLDLTWKEASEMIEDLLNKKQDL